jgi:transcriptional regulator with XRE-family HTH domain
MRITSTLSDQLRREILESGLSPYALARLLEIDKSAVSRFLNGKAGLSLEVIDRLCQILGLQLTKAQVVQGRDHRFSTTPGFTNANGQRVIKRATLVRSEIGQYAYLLECTKCGFQYHAWGCDIKGANKGAGRRCPSCQGGTPGVQSNDKEKSEAKA